MKPSIIAATFATIVLNVFSLTSNAQTMKNLPFREIPDYPAEYNEGTIASRLVEGLGFRFYWATDGLEANDLLYKPTEDSRTIDQTVDHIYGMTIMILNTMDTSKNEVKTDQEFASKREMVLISLQKISEILRSSSADDLESFTINFRSGAKLPFWNLINGPISDCIWHCGQIVSLRRASGNPFSAEVSLMTGKKR